MSSKPYPTTEVERSLAPARYVIGIDEVGRGAIAGPVAVGAFVIDLKNLDVANIPTKLQDSKLMTERSRELVFEELATWSPGYAVGMVDAIDIDLNGIVWALAQAAVRALNQLADIPELTDAVRGGSAHILLDGTHNWLQSVVSRIPVTVRAKADRDCVSVAAASVMAKVTRDRLMVELAKDHPNFGMESHKGYASATHIEAIKSIGPTTIHRISWLSRIYPR